MLILTPVLLRKTSTVSRSSIGTTLSSLTVSSNLKQETKIINKFHFRTSLFFFYFRTQHIRLFRFLPIYQAVCVMLDCLTLEQKHPEISKKIYKNKVRHPLYAKSTTVHYLTLNVSFQIERYMISKRIYLFNLPMKDHSQGCLYFCHCKGLSYAIPAKSNHGQKLIR